MWSEIKSILQDAKNRCIIIEDGKPRYVVVPFDEYQKLQKNDGHSTMAGPKDSDREPYATEHVNHELQEIWELGEKDREPEKKAASISIEDLPF
jgi:hypothetical protein